MKKQMIIVSVIVIVVLLSGFTMNLRVNEDIPYPEGFRKWTHIKTGFLGPEHPNVQYRGFNHVYANDKAIRGYETGVFPDGSIIVFDVIEAAPQEKQIKEGKRHHTDIMVRDSLKFGATGGWNYGQFEADKTPRVLTIDAKKQCFNCHISQKDYVFTEFRP
jgi:hypothetical protein